MIALEKANNDLISHCQCDKAYIGLYGQPSCPWCGCSWMFHCSKCRKAFTFARGVETDLGMEEWVDEDLRGWGLADEMDLTAWISDMERLQTFQLVNPEDH